MASNDPARGQGFQVAPTGSNLLVELAGTLEMPTQAGQDSRVKTCVRSGMLFPLSSECSSDHSGACHVVSAFDTHFQV